MVRFFFNVRNGADFLEDTEGVEMCNGDAAEQEAVLFAREVLGEFVLQGEILGSQAFEITDANGRIVATVPFKAAFN
jgi:hypothetical protein